MTDSVSHVTDTITFKGPVGSFSAQSDGSGGTLITDPTPSPTIATVSHGQDAFVFASHLGENATTYVNVHNDALDLSHSGFAELAAITTQAHEDGANWAPHDAGDDIMQHSAASSSHDYHFFV